VKLFAFLYTCSVITAWAQSSGQVGIRTGQVQTVYLIEPAHTESLEDYVARLSREAGGRDLQLDSLNLTTDGSRLLVPPVEPTARVDFETWVEGIGKQRAESLTSGFSSVKRETGRVTIQRYVRDNFRHVEARYVLVVELLAESGSYRAHFDNSPAKGEATAPDWRVKTLTEYPVAQILRDGDVVSLDLGGDSTDPKPIDYIHFGRLLPVFRKEAAREVYSEDAEFNISQPRLRINGAEKELPGAEALHGPLLWVFVPGQGLYELSFKPRPGFDLAGECSGNSLIFSTAHDLFRLDAAERIAVAGSAIYRVYARKDGTWTPPNPKDASHITIGIRPAM
jgi:hypothetical protein